MLTLRAVCFQRRAAQRVQATSFLDVYLLPQAKFLQVCKKDRIEMDTVFEWDKVDNVVRDVDTEAPEKAIDGVSAIAHPCSATSALALRATPRRALPCLSAPLAGRYRRASSSCGSCGRSASSRRT